MGCSQFGKVVNLFALQRAELQTSETQTNQFCLSKEHRMPIDFYNRGEWFRREGENWAPKCKMQILADCFHSREKSRTKKYFPLIPIVFFLSGFW